MNVLLNVSSSFVKLVVTNKNMSATHEITFPAIIPLLLLTLQHHYSRQQAPSHDLIQKKMSFYFNVFTVTANIKEWDFGFVLT